ncbi:MAG: hypothetical protein NUV93_04570 [Firmicutes bacterium]|jgi:hypothetical protein|nr:hypothetical protein [Bacillota bacterium]
MRIGELALEPRDVSLIKALRPYAGAFGQRLIDTIVDMASLQSDGGEVQVLSPVWFSIKLQEVIQNAFTLFLILILLLLSTGAWGWTAPKE